MEKFKKIIRLIILGAAILYAGYLIGYWTKYYVYQYKSNPERIYKQDTFGGKTPQETYEMFVSALKTRNIELASKYFVLSKQSEKLKDFQGLRTKEELQKYIEGLPEWGEMEETDRKSYRFAGENKIYEYEYTSEKEIEIFDQLLKKNKIIPPGIYKTDMIFKLNTATNIWKIDIL